MKNLALATLPLALLTGCETLSTPLDRSVPVPPELPAQLRAECPKLALLTDNSIATLAREDTAAAVEYAKCREGKAGVVAAYDAAREEALKANKR